MPKSTASLLKLPRSERSPWWDLVRRMSAALAVVAAAVIATMLVRDGYVDASDPTGEVSLSDAFYYATVSLSTTGYGDITPVTTQARWANTILITPLRVAFLGLLVGTTIEVLASQGRDRFRNARWRKNMDEHVVVIGYGTKGRSAVDTLISNGVKKESIIVVDPNHSALDDAHADGVAVVTGDATRREVLGRAAVAQARQVIVTTNRDDSTVLTVLNVRQLNPGAYVVAAVREHNNVALVQQSGANSVITSSDAVGRLLGLSTVSPDLGSVMADLLEYGEGLEIAEREVLASEVGKEPRQLDDQVIAVVRHGKVHRFFEPGVKQLAAADRLIVVRPSEELASDPRPGAEEETTDEA